MATVNLSDRFAVVVGSLSIRGRLAEVAFTVTQFSNVREVRLKRQAGDGVFETHPGSSFVKGLAGGIPLPRTVWC